MRIYFVAGEKSGDNHGAGLMQALRSLQPEIAFFGRGGPQMKQIAGPDFLDWSEEAGVVGLWEVLKHYRYFRRQFHQTLREIAQAKPDAVVLIDYPGFNLRLAKTLQERSLGGKILYYISPQVWAWNRGRIPKMARWIDLMICIFPFEAQLYEPAGLPAVFVGHPMIDRLATQLTQAPREANLIGFFPGSREREVRKLLPVFREVMQLLKAQRPALSFEIAAASEKLAGTIRHYLENEESLGNVKIVVGQTPGTMQRSAAGVVASGTATLEAAYFRLPFVLVYKVATLTYLAAKVVVQVKHLGMPNVLAGREIVPEFIQHNAQPEAIAREVLRLLDDPARRAKMIADFDAVIAKLGKGGANRAAARVILQALA